MSDKMVDWIQQANLPVSRKWTTPHLGLQLFLVVLLHWAWVANGQPSSNSISGLVPLDAGSNAPAPLREGSEDRFVRLSAQLKVIEVTSPRPGMKPLTTNLGPRIIEWPTVSLVCVLGKKGWKLEGNFSRNAIEKWFFDGTNVTRSTQITGLDTSELQGLSLEEVKSHVTLNIYQTPGGYPPGAAPIDLAWLAFCSGDYLKRSGRIIPLPVPTFLIGTSPDAFAYSDKTETFDDELGLPRTVELLTSQSMYEAAAAKFWKHQPPENKGLLKSNQPDGLRKFYYKVTASTNFLGWNLPLSFEFSEDIPNDDYPTLATFHGSAVVTSISGLSAKPEGVFNSQLEQTVLDRRFKFPEQRVNGIMYSWSNEFVPPTNDARLQLELNVSIKRSQYEASKRKYK